MAMLLALAVSAEALVFTEDVMDEDGNVIQRGGVIVDNPYAALYSEFFTDDKYPDDFAGVWVEDGKTMYVFALVEGTDASKYEAVLGDYVGQYRFEYLPYSYNTLMHMRDVVFKRLNDIMTFAGVGVSDNKIYFDVWVDEAEENGRVAQAMLDIKNEENLPDGIENAFVVECGVMLAVADEDAVLDNEPIPLGTFTVLHSLYNRGMMYEEIFFGNITNNVIHVSETRLYDNGIDNEITGYEVLSDGTLEGDAALELFLQNREIRPGTQIELYMSPYEPVTEPADGEVGYEFGIERIVFGGMSELSTEDYRRLFDYFNCGNVYAQDRLVQLEHEFNADGELIVNRVELEPQDYLYSFDWLTVLYTEPGDGNSVTIVLGKTWGAGDVSAFIVELPDAGDIATPDDGTDGGRAAGDLYRSSRTIEPGTPVKLIFRSEEPAIAPPVINAGDVYGLMFYEGALDYPVSEMEAIVDALNDGLMAQGARGPMFRLTSERTVERLAETPAPSAPATGMTLAILPIIPALAALAISKNRR